MSAKRRMLWLAMAALACTLPGVAAAADADPKMPKPQEYSYAWDMAYHSLVRPITRMADEPLLLRRMVRHPREAANVDEHDQVLLPSTWWKPRLGYRQVSVEQMLRGPGPRTGPVGQWHVTKLKTQGITPGFQMKDAKKDLYFIKFDLAKNPELTTSLDVIGSLLYWAAGYNVPENTIAYFDPDSLVFDDKATYTDHSGKKHPLTREVLNEVLTHVYRQPDGRFRVVASLAIKGKPLGPFKYQGRRDDDPEDLIPHQLRRELRGLWAMHAWTNHADSRGPNSLDMWVKDHDRSFVRHNLIDFSGILGSGGLTKRSYATGTEYYLDGGVMTTELFTLGLLPFEWEGVVDPNLPSVGFVESVKFDPRDWKPDYPNPALDDRTARDVRWGARIVAAFNDDLIRAAVQDAQYSDPRASAYLTKVLMERRDKIVKAWLGSAPLAETGIGTTSAR